MANLFSRIRAIRKRKAGHKSDPKLLPPYFRKELAVYNWAPASEDSYRNFGDELSPMIVERMIFDRGFRNVKVIAAPRKKRSKLLAVGSVLQKARNGDVVWGSGVNGKTWVPNLVENKKIDVRAVRGPLTRNALIKSGIPCPEIFGDPGFLFPELFAQEIADEEKSVLKDYPNLGVIYVPNLNDDRFLGRPTNLEERGIQYVRPSENPNRMAQIISKSELVISSSLHGIILADSYGVPCRPVLSWFEPVFKYFDYFYGTGRYDVQIYRDPVEALNGTNLPLAKFDPTALLDAFPFDLIHPL